jgi:hypothetical protein
MEQPELNNLKYGIIYLLSDRSLPPGYYNPEEVVKRFVQPMEVQWVDEPGRKDLLLIARRFNVGNMGRYATVSLSLSRMNRSGGWFEAIRHFADALMGVADAGDGDIVINEEDLGHQYENHSSVFGGVQSAAPQDNTRVASRWRRLAARFRDMLSEPEQGVLLDSASCREDSVQPDYLQEEEDQELLRLERERKQALERIKREIVNYIAHYHEDPKELMAELLRGKVVVGRPGRVIVNGNMKIVLPEYDELEIPMPAMCRTLYILFMKHRVMGQGGFELKNIDLYRDEMVDIYSLVKPGADDDRVRRTVDNLCDPFSNSLNEAISRANGFIRKCIVDKNLQKQYLISGARGGKYSIGLSPEMIALPNAVMQEGIA